MKKKVMWHEVKKHEDALEAWIFSLDNELGLLRDIERECRKYLRGALKEHEWLLKHARVR